MPVRAWVEPLTYEADFLHLIDGWGNRSVITHDVGGDLFAMMARAMVKPRTINGARFICSPNMREAMDYLCMRERSVLVQINEQIPVDYAASFRGVPIEVI